MIDQLKQMAIFAHVVDEGSFRATARKLGLAPSRISETVSDLEKQLGVTLLYRSTRKLSLTNEGRILHARVVDMLQSAELGLNEVNALSDEPAGSLRISIPAFLTTGPLSTAIAGFTKKHPKVTVSVSYTDRRMRLVEDGFDMTIRVGWLEDSSNMCRKLSTGHRHLVAGLEYAKARDTPQQPSDLSDWDWVLFDQRPAKLEFTSKTGETQTITTKGQIEVDSIEAVYHIATCNMGATVLPSFLARRGIEAGKLVRLLPEWELDTLGIYAVWPNDSHRESLALVFVRHLAEQGLC